jgi:hypothetical protein
MGCCDRWRNLRYRVFMLASVIQKFNPRLYFTITREITTLGFEDIITSARLELKCRFLHLVNNKIN